MKHRTISRRHLVASGLGAIAAPAVLRLLPANAQSRVIKIGHVSPRTGPIAAFGEADPFILEQVQKLLEKGISNARELTELMTKANTEALNVINKRVTESFDEVRDFAQKRAGAR